VAPFLPLPGSYDEYLERLPSKLRHEIKRKARRLEAEVGPWHICLGTPETLEAFLDRFVDLHRTSEGPKGVFMQPGMEIFFRRLGEAFLPRGIFSLTFIETAEHLKLAGSIGFRFEGTTSLYNSAFDRAYQPVSPGMVLVAEDIRIAIEAGSSAFDMLKGDYAYKYRFGAVPRAIKRLVVTR
jgi:CelD/BcsL family acetyltransferase involved in cellulose biosynthesis